MVPFFPLVGKGSPLKSTDQKRMSFFPMATGHLSFCSFPEIFRKPHLGDLFPEMEVQRLLVEDDFYVLFEMGATCSNWLVGDN